MSRKRTALIFAWVASVALAVAPNALATTHGGQGIYGPTGGLLMTQVMLGLILFFPTIIVIFSIIQSRLDHRKHARMDAARRRETAEEWKGGW
jgi:uncharacterized membrane protein